LSCVFVGVGENGKKERKKKERKKEREDARSSKGFLDHLNFFFPVERPSGSSCSHDTCSGVLSKRKLNQLIDRLSCSSTGQMVRCWLPALMSGRGWVLLLILQLSMLITLPRSVHLIKKCHLVYSHSIALIACLPPLLSPFRLITGTLKH
jgi:hypothetical protein